MRIDNHAGLEAAQLEALARLVARHETLQDVVRWGVLYTPPLLIVDIVVQDEFTHDVIVPFRDGLHLVYDTT
jgi:hypothetical protein